MFLSASDMIGYLAGIITTASFAPQVIKTLRTHSTNDISLVMYVLIAIGIGLWLVHGAMIGSMPILVANGVTLVLVGIMLFMKLRYK